MDVICVGDGVGVFSVFVRGGGVQKMKIIWKALAALNLGLGLVNLALYAHGWLWFNGVIGISCFAVGVWGMLT